MFRNAHVRISGHAGHSGKESIVTAPAGFRLSGRKRFRQLCARAAAFAARQGKPLPRKLQHFHRMLQKASRIRLIMEKSISQELFLLKARSEKRKNRHEKTGPVCGIPFFHLSAAFLPCDQTACLHYTGVRGVEAKQRAKRKPVFGKKKFHGIRRFHGTLVRSTGLEPVPLSDTPLKRARMPIPPRSRVAVSQR